MGSIYSLGRHSKVYFKPTLCAYVVEGALGCYIVCFSVTLCAYVVEGAPMLCTVRLIKSLINHQTNFHSLKNFNIGFLHPPASK